MRPYSPRHLASSCRVAAPAALRRRRSGNDVVCGYARGDGRNWEISSTREGFRNVVKRCKFGGSHLRFEGIPRQSHRSGLAEYLFGALFLELSRPLLKQFKMALSVLVQFMSSIKGGNMKYPLGGGRGRDARSKRRVSDELFFQEGGCDYVRPIRLLRYGIMGA